MDTLVLLELTDNLTEALAGLEKAKDDTLATLDAIDAVNDALIALGGESAKQSESPKENKSIEDKNIFLRQIANDEINVFVDQSKLSELESIDENSVDMEVYSQAAVNAAKQVLTGYSYPVVV